MVKALGGRNYFTVEDFNKLQTGNPDKFNTISQLISLGRAYVVNDKTNVVLTGT